MVDQSLKYRNYFNFFHPFCHNGHHDREMALIIRSLHVGGANRVFLAALVEQTLFFLKFMFQS